MMMRDGGVGRRLTWLGRPLLLSLVAGLVVWGAWSVTGAVGTAHAAAATITDCSDDSQLQSAVANAASGDTITFGCSGDITLTQTLTINKNLTLDGSGQSVTLDGGGSVQALLVKSGANFTLKDLTVAHGHTVDHGGGIENSGTVAIIDSTVANNSAGLDSGGLENSGTMTISHSTITNNSAPSAGGLSNSGTMTISNSTFANNSAGINGGGLFNSATMTISNSTVTNNSASVEVGGGLWNDGTAMISNSTFANNSAALGGGLYNNGGTVSSGGSIVANNTAPFGDANCGGSGLSDQGYNLESGTDCGFTGTGDLQNTDPQLDPNGLQNNGGPTQTIALQQGSPAIDQIPVASCPQTDQRGFARPDDGETTCDIGAYESGAQLPDTDLGLINVPANLTVDATSPQGAVVSYTPPTVVDEDSPLPTVSCAPASGSTFAIGTTTVNCSVSDSDDTNSPVSASFTVTVNGAPAQLTELMSLVTSFGLPADLQASFDTQLQAVQTDLTSNNTKQACNDLAAFNNHVQAQSGKHLTASQASQLLTAAAQIGAVLGC